MSEIAEKVTPITITSLAASNITELMDEKGLGGHFLRIYVAGIGCSGPQYGLAFDENQRESDLIVESGGLQVLVDPTSLAYLDGATVDYVQTPQGAGFKIENTNPMAAAACGSCGGSCG